MTDDAPAPEAPEEESYFVSMTDIMVGLLFVFIIMLMTFALKYRDAEAARNKETQTIQSADELAEAAKRRLLTDVEEYLRERGVKVTVDVQQGVIRLPESVLFERARAELDADGRGAVGHVAAAVLSAEAPRLRGALADPQVARRVFDPLGGPAALAKELTEGPGSPTEVLERHGLKGPAAKGGFVLAVFVALLARLGQAMAAGGRARRTTGHWQLLRPSG